MCLSIVQENREDHGQSKEQSDIVNAVQGHQWLFVHTEPSCLNTVFHSIASFDGQRSILRFQFGHPLTNCFRFPRQKNVNESVRFQLRLLDQVAREALCQTRQPVSKMARPRILFYTHPPWDRIYKIVAQSQTSLKYRLIQHFTDLATDRCHLLSWHGIIRSGAINDSNFQILLQQMV